MRSTLDSNRIARVIFCMGDGHMILLHGFIKKTQKTPQADIDLALKRNEGGDVMAQKRKASVSEETFDEFLASQGMLEACEDHAIKELIAEQLADAMDEQGIDQG